MAGCGGRGFITRIWPTNKLTKLFEDAAFGEFDIGYTDKRETIILRDEDKDEVDYTDKAHIKQLRPVVQQYNKLLEKTFIDIQSVDKPARIEWPEGKKRRRSNRRVFASVRAIIKRAKTKLSQTVAELEKLNEEERNHEETHREAINECVKH